MKTTSERIKAIRQASGLSAQKFGDKYGIPLRTIQDWERGQRKPPEYVINMIERLEAIDKQ